MHYEYVIVQVSPERYVVAERKGDYYKAITKKLIAKTARRVRAEILEKDEADYSAITVDALDTWS